MSKRRPQITSVNVTITVAILTDADSLAAARNAVKVITESSGRVTANRAPANA